MGRYTFNSAASKAMLIKIHGAIRSLGGATKHELYLVTRLSDRRISQYLRHLADVMDVVHKLPRVGSSADVWVDGPAPKPEATEEDDDGIDYAPRRVHVCRTWVAQPVQHHELHAAFFGQQKG